MANGDEFGGLKEFVEKAAAPAAPAPAAPPAAEPKAETPPAAAQPAPAPPAPPAAATTPIEQPAAPAPAAPASTRVKVRGKVAGEETDLWEVDPADLANPDSEASKQLRDHLQRSKDYDRPGGALDQSATRRAQELMEKELLARGFLVRDAQGKAVWNPTVLELAERARQAATPPAPAQQAPSAAPTAPAAGQPTERQRRIAELRTKHDDPKQEWTARDDWEARELIAQEEAQKIARQEARAALTERETQAREEYAKYQETRQRQEEENRRAQENQAEIDRTVAGLESLLRDPVTGQVDTIYTGHAKAVMTDVLVRTHDWNAARAEVRKFAEDRAASVRKWVESQPKIATAPPPAPVAPAGQPANDAKPKEKVFDPSNPFTDGGLASWAKEQRAGA